MSELQVPPVPAGLGSRQRIAFLLLLLLAVALYAPSLHGPLVHDDLAHLGPHSSLNWKSFDDPAIAETIDANPTRMLGMGTFGVQHLLFGESTLAGKAINLAIHLINATLLLLVVLRLTTLAGGMAPARRGWLAIVVAGVWLLHPLQVSTVAYSIQRLAQLPTLFILAAMIPWLQWLQEGRPAQRTWLALLAFGLTIPAFFNKENGALLPLFLLLCLPLTGWRPRLPQSMTARGLLLLAAAGIVAAVWQLLPGFWRGQVMGSYLIRDFDLWQRLMTEARVLVFYLSEILWPAQSRMSLHLDDIAISRDLWTPWTTLPAILVVAGIASAGSWLLLARRSLVGFGLLFFLAGHLVESTVIGLEIAYEHRNYLPMAGILLAVAVLAERIPRPSLATGVAVLALAACTINLGLRTATWSDNFRLHADMVANHPDSSRAHYGLAQELLRRAQDTPEIRREALELALHHLRRAAALSPSNIGALHIMATLLPPGTPEYEAVWNEMYARARFGAPGRGMFNPLQEMTRCAVEEPGCPLPVDRVERLFRAALDNPAPTTRFFRLHTPRLFGTLLVRAAGRIDEGLEVSRRVATPACPKCRLSYLRNLVAAGRLAEARAYYPRVLAEGPLETADTASLARARELLERAERKALDGD